LKIEVVLNNIEVLDNVIVFSYGLCLAHKIVERLCVFFQKISYLKNNLYLSDITYKRF
jgi:hypothetical protein